MESVKKREWEIGEEDLKRLKLAGVSGRRGGEIWWKGYREVVVNIMLEGYALSPLLLVRLV